MPSKSALLSRRALFEFGILAVLAVVYNVVRAGGGPVTEAIARRHAHDIINAEGWWFEKVELGLNHWIVGITVLSVAACYFYALMHYVMTPFVLLMSRKRGGYKYFRGFVALVLACLFALVIYANVPVAPPRLMPSTGAIDVMARFSNWGWWGAAASAPRGLGDATNQFAAFPSMHFGWSLWCGIQMWGFGGRKWKIAAVAYPTLQAFVVISTANHYVVDVFAGAFCTLLGYGTVTVAHKVYLRFQASRAPGPRAEATEEKADVEVRSATDAA